MNKIKVLGFDLDGTLVIMKLDFRKIRDEMGIDTSDTLKYLRSLPEDESKRLYALLEQRELDAAEKAEPAPGAQELLSHCREKGIKIVVITRNSTEAARRTLQKLGMEADMVVSRDDAEPKPSPEALELVLAHFGIKPHEMAYIGDYLFDIQAGNAAGVKTILISSQEASDEWAPLATYVAEDLYEVLDLMIEGVPLKG